MTVQPGTQLSVLSSRTHLRRPYCSIKR